MANIVERMFGYWNDAFQSVEGFTETSFAQFFTQDAILRVNGKDRPSGPAGLAGHFNRIRASAEQAVIRLPLDHSFVGGLEIFIHYRLDLVIEGEKQAEEAMGYCRLQEDKISLMNVISRHPA